MRHLQSAAMAMRSPGGSALHSLHSCAIVSGFAWWVLAAAELVCMSRSPPHSVAHLLNQLEKVTLEVNTEIGRIIATLRKKYAHLANK